MTRLNLEAALQEANERKYERIVKCRHCGTPGLIFDVSANGNRWLYEASEILSKDELDAVKDPENVAHRFSKFLREVALGRDAEGNLATGFVLVFKHKPHPACLREAQMAQQLETEAPAETGTIDVTVSKSGQAIHPDDQAQDESLDSEYDGTQEPETSEEYLGLNGYQVSDDED